MILWQRTLIDKYDFLFVYLFYPLGFDEKNPVKSSLCQIELINRKNEKKSIYYTFIIPFAQNAETLSDETIYEQMYQIWCLYFTCFSTFLCASSLWRNFSTIFTLKMASVPRSYLGDSRHRDLGTEIYCIIL